LTVFVVELCPYAQLRYFLLDHQTLWVKYWFFLRSYSFAIPTGVFVFTASSSTQFLPIFDSLGIFWSSIFDWSSTQEFGDIFAFFVLSMADLP